MAAAVLLFRGAQRGGKTALMWHVLRQEASRAGLPIECASCEKPHETPPLFGRCACGSYTFLVRRPVVSGQLPLGLDFHAGEP